MNAKSAIGRTEKRGNREEYRLCIALIDCRENVEKENESSGVSGGEGEKRIMKGNGVIIFGLACIERKDKKISRCL